ncbi:outer membrane protein assembly factor BamD [bacterium]|nr:outer membrane protein assembly factor BamD [bacterium]
MNYISVAKSVALSFLCLCSIALNAHKGSSCCSTTDSCQQKEPAISCCPSNEKTSCKTESCTKETCSADTCNEEKTNLKKKKSKKEKTPTVAKKEKKKRKTLSTYDYETLKKEKEKFLAKGNNDLAIKFIEKMVPLCTDLAELSGLMLELADLLFETSHLVKAERLYTEFVHLYPGHKQAEYASYKSILCSYWKTLDHFRDQSKTHETLALVDTFLQRKEIFTTYQKEVIEIQTSCQEKLLDSEVSIFNFYLQRGDLLAAKTRLENIEKEFLTLLPDKEPILISLACDLAQKENNTTVLEEKKLLLEQKFPEYIQQKTVIADAKQTRSNVDRF